MRNRVLIVLLVLTGIARAEVESDLVKAGVAAYEDLEYGKSVELLKKALRETLTKEERVVTYRTMAFAHVALNKPDDAREDFESLLRIDPSYQPDRTISPRVRTVFEAAKAHVATSAQPVGDENRTPAVQPRITPAEPRAGQPVSLRLDYPGGVAVKVELFYRTRGQNRFSSVEVAGHAGHFEVTVPGLHVGAPAFEWYLLLLDDTGSAVATAGSRGQPLAFDVAARKVPIYKRGVFWGVLGGVLAAGAIVGGVLAATLPSKIGPNTPATLTIMPN